MYVRQPKKMLIINILDILRRYSDENHRLSQKDIIEILETEYSMKVDRKSIKRNLMNLVDFGYPLEHSDSIRKNKYGEEEIIYSDWYLNRDFTDAELRLLIDSLLFSKHIPYSQCKELIGKIENLSSRYFRSKVRHICNLPTDMPENKELFFTIEILDEAIEKNRKVEFQYCDYGTDKLMHPRLNSEGKARTYVVNPYQMAATNGKYYLIANYDKYDNISHYRVDRIKKIRITDSPAKPLRKIEGMKNGLNLPKHMAEHIYMFSGESDRVVVKTTKGMAGELIDWFGSDIRFSDEDGDSICAHIKVNLKAMRFWALQYAPYVTVLEPQSLVEQIKSDLKNSLMNYDSAVK